MAQVKVLKAFSTYPDGKTRTHYPLGDAQMMQQTIDEFKLVEKGLVALVKKKPKEAE